MITELSPLLSRVSSHVDPRDLLLSKGAWVLFSREWPSTWKWCSGKLFEVSEEPILTKYFASYILPGSDYKTIDLSNATDGLKLYPEEEGVIYQCGVGFKPGDYIVNIYTPSSSKYVYSLGDASMFPDVSDASKRYLGAKSPSDSPAETPLLYFYFIKNGPAIYLQPYILESVTYDKATVSLFINKCKLREIPLVPDKADKARRIAFYKELTGY